MEEKASTRWPDCARRSCRRILSRDVCSCSGVDAELQLALGDNTREFDMGASWSIGEHVRRQTHSEDAPSVAGSATYPMVQRVGVFPVRLAFPCGVRSPSCYCPPTRFRITSAWR